LAQIEKKEKRKKCDKRRNRKIRPEEHHGCAACVKRPSSTKSVDKRNRSRTESGSQSHCAGLQRVLSTVKAVRRWLTWVKTTGCNPLHIKNHPSNKSIFSLHSALGGKIVCQATKIHQKNLPFKEGVHHFQTKSQYPVEGPKGREKNPTYKKKN